MSNRVKAIVTSALAFGALAIPGFTAFVTALGGDASVMQAVVGGYAVYHVIRLAVDYFHAAVTGSVLLALALLLPAGASAQDVTQRGTMLGRRLPEGAIRSSVEFRLVAGSEDSCLSSRRSRRY